MVLYCASIFVWKWIGCTIVFSANTSLNRQQHCPQNPTPNAIVNFVVVRYPICVDLVEIGVYQLLQDFIDSYENEALD